MHGARLRARAGLTGGGFHSPKSEAVVEAAIYKDVYPAPLGGARLVVVLARRKASLS